MEEIIDITLPVGYIEEDGYHIMFNTDETNKYLDLPVVIQEHSKEEAIKRYWDIVGFHLRYMEERSRLLDRWHPLQIGPWKYTAGKWFTTFGIHIYFRYGKGMKGGRYIPFTKLNISVHNYWKRRKQ